MAFLRNLLATILGLTIFSVILFFFGMIMLVALASSGDEIPTVKSNSVLYLHMSGVIQERVADDPLQDLLLNDGPKPIGLMNTLDVLAAAKDDKRIRGIYLESNFIQGGSSSLSEIRDALKAFKETGKFIYAYGTYMTEADFYLASVADSLFLNPEGSLELNGLSANLTFYKGAFEKLGVEPEIFRVGKYKSFVEPYIRKDMSDENRYQTEALLNSIYDVYTKDIAGSVSKTQEEIREISDKMLVRLPEDAVNHGLVKRLAYEDEVKALVRSEMGLLEDRKVNYISGTDYYRNVGSRFSVAGSDKIAVIVAEGDIVMGGGSGNIAGDRFAKEIRKARKNDQIKAIVLRVNSPGGSLTASDIIWREIMLTKEEKPIIASMGDVAASGGYFISMPCDAILARPNTITGSIGIFGMMFNLSDMLEDKLGITHDVVNTGEYSDIMTVTRTLRPEERAIIQQGVDKGYETFLTKAADGRGVTVEAIEELASGRVWTGSQALENGLIDEFGGLDEAIALAADKAGLLDDQYAVRYYPQQEMLLDKFLGNTKDNVREKIADEQYGELAPFIKKLKNLQNYQGIQARLPYEIEIN
ncbi:MAG: signal peptide peptidase SppA [Bacteroidota bacterium]